jgi:DNA-directed RNA polymerase subunit delta
MADEAQVLQYSPDELEEMALVDIAYDILRSKTEPMYYRDLINDVARIRGLTEEELNQVIARVYTEINVDGRFICIGNNIWGLKRWYPVDKAMDKTAGTKQFIRKDLDDDFYDDDDEVDELFEESDGEDDAFDPYAEDEVEDIDTDDFDDLDDEADLEEESFEELGEAEAEESDEDEEDF